METTIEQQVAMDEALVPNVHSTRHFWLQQMCQRFICRNFGLQQLSIISLSDSRWIIKSIFLSWNHSGTYYISFQESKFGALLPIELTNEKIRNSKAYKEYYAIATEEAAPKPKASSRRTRSGSDTSITPPTAAAKHAADAYMSQPSGSGADEGTGSKPGVPDVPTDESEEELLWNSTDDEGDDDKGKDGDDDEEDERDDDEEGEEDDDDENKDGDEKDDADEDQEVTKHDDKDDTEESGDDDEEGGSMESIFETTSRIDVQTPTSVAPVPMTTPTMTSSIIATTTTISQAPILPTPIPSDVLQHLLFSAIPGIVQHYIDQRMNKAVQVIVQLQSDRHREEAQRENDEFLRTAVNKQLEAEVLTRSSHSSRTSYAVAANLSEIELKKILIKKMEGNKSIQCSDEQRNLYKALVDAYESNKIILDTYGESVTLKRRRDDDEDKDEELIYVKSYIIFLSKLSQIQKPSNFNTRMKTRSKAESGSSFSRINVHEAQIYQESKV
uniref:Uncharacterized protein n=1 Tax=Tanacetum cinerariifolium TaxID=118510 RepID=A0A6L2K7F3_TANCI|nr:hypothetical protein [Tanacetum cinerariifolium]